LFIAQKEQTDLKNVELGSESVFFAIYTLDLATFSLLFFPNLSMINYLKSTKMDTKKSISVLNVLIEINNDRIEGYLTASKETKEGDLISLFEQFAETSHVNRVDLVTEVRKLGGTPDESTKATGKLFRLWMELKTLVTGNDLDAILGSCEFGEDAALEAYSHALQNHTDVLTLVQLALLKTQMSRIKQDQNRVKEMRGAILITK
jgi:uncharacterized protein (TIGR02284 family)